MYLSHKSAISLAELLQVLEVFLQSDLSFSATLNLVVCIIKFPCYICLRSSNKT